jgi:hypothetical protein
MNPGAVHFFRFLLYLFLALFAAESQSLLIAALVPVSFANGLWMVSPHEEFVGISSADLFFSRSASKATLSARLRSRASGTTPRTSL